MVRDDKGRFIKGNGGGPGRPKKRKEERFYEILITTVTEEDWRDIIRRAVNDAKKGDTSARTWLSNYYAGPPVERKEVTGADGKPFTIQLSWGDNADADAED